MEDRNIPAQHDAARKSLKCELLLWGPFLYYSTNITDVNSGPSHRKMTAVKQLLQAQAIGHSTAVGWLPNGYGGEKGWSQSGEHEMQWKEWKKENQIWNILRINRFSISMSQFTCQMNEDRLVTQLSLLLCDDSSTGNPFPAVSLC